MKLSHITAHLSSLSYRFAKVFRHRSFRRASRTWRVLSRPKGIVDPQVKLMIYLLTALTASVCIPAPLRHSKPSHYFDPNLTITQQRGRSDCRNSSILPTYVFLHLHKTGGNNLKVALIGFANRHKLKLYHTCRPAEAESGLQRWYFQRNKNPLHDADCDLYNFAKLPVEQRNSFDIIIGHQYYGVHHLIPGRDVRYFTILRHPLARKVSHFIHFNIPVGRAGSIPPRGLHANAPLNNEILDYLTQNNLNYMVKRLSLPGTSSEIVLSLRSSLIDHVPYYGIRLLQSAQKNIASSFFFVGVYERYAESICVLSNSLNNACYKTEDGVNTLTGKLLNASKIARAAINVRNKTKAFMAILSNEGRSAALKAEKLDMMLYISALKAFNLALHRFPECRKANEQP